MRLSVTHHTRPVAYALLRQPIVVGRDRDATFVSDPNVTETVTRARIYAVAMIP